MSEMTEARKIWQTLSKLNVNEFTEKKANLTYLSWAIVTGKQIGRAHV